MINNNITNILLYYNLYNIEYIKDKYIFIQNMIDNTAIHMSRKLELIGFGDYGEDAFLGHIIACQELVKYLVNLRISNITILSSTKFESNQEIDKSNNYNNIINEYNLTDICISTSVLDSVCTIILSNAENAASTVVKNIIPTFDDIINLFFDERSGNIWIGDKVCKAFIERVITWLNTFRNIRGIYLHSEFRNITTKETMRILLTLYLMRLIDKYKNNKKFKLSDDGVSQVTSDLRLIGEAILQLGIEFQQCDKIHNYSSQADSEEAPSCVTDITALIKMTRLFISSDEDNLLLCYAEAVQHFGFLSTPQLYDLIRLSLKIRKDLTDSKRRKILSLCSEYITQLSNSTIDGFGPMFHMTTRLSGPDILQELFPQAGVLHCTGKKFSYEKLPESDTLSRFEIAKLVTDSCTIARMRRSHHHVLNTYNFSNNDIASSNNNIGGNGNDSVYSKWHKMYPNDMKSTYVDTQINSTVMDSCMHSSLNRGVSIDTVNSEVSEKRIESLASAHMSTPSPSRVVSFANSVIDFSTSFAKLHYNICPEVYHERSFIYTLKVKPYSHEEEQIRIQSIKYDTEQLQLQYQNEIQKIKDNAKSYVNNDVVDEYNVVMDCNSLVHAIENENHFNNSNECINITIDNLEVINDVGNALIQSDEECNAENDNIKKWDEEVVKSQSEVLHKSMESEMSLDLNSQSVVEVPPIKPKKPPKPIKNIMNNTSVATNTTSTQPDTTVRESVITDTILSDNINDNLTETKTDVTDNISDAEVIQTVFPSRRQSYPLPQKPPILTKPVKPPKPIKNL
jgi:hypothetical protein